MPAEVAVLRYEEVGISPMVLMLMLMLMLMRMRMTI